MDVPIFVFTGGDRLKRPDLYELIRYCDERALRDTGRLEGKCGACEYQEICAGSPGKCLRGPR